MIDPLYLFVFAGLFSPGPNVILLTASGARFGFRRTIPHIVGIALGVGITAGLTGAGIAAVLRDRPGLEWSLKLVSAAWIFWMAWSLFRHAARPACAHRGRPFTVTQAVLFQWVNPKVWAIALAAASGYAAGLGPVGDGFRLATAFAGINLFVCLFWASAGSFLAVLLASPRAWRWFLRIMATLLAASGGAIFV